MERPQADLVLRGRVFTVDDGHPWSDAVAVRGGRIVGLADVADDLIGEETEVVDAGDGLVLPGFIDSHNHVRLGTPDALDLSAASSLEAIHDTLRAHVAADPSLEWIEAGRWTYGAIPGGRMPTADDLPDEVTGGRPAFLVAYDAHTVWMNRPALERFGIGRGTERVPFGEVGLDADGEPTGFVTGFAVMGLSRDGLAALEPILPGLSKEAQYRRLARALDLATSVGITTVVEPQNSVDDLPLFERARREGAMRSRVIAALFHPVGTTDADVDAFEDARRRFDDDRFRVGPIKLYIDDVIEPRTAAMLEGYATAPDERGETFWEPDAFAELIASLDARGFQTFTHATGDRGIRTALDAIAHARAVNGPREARHQIVHCELVHPDDQPRFAELGVVACMQPRHCSADLVAGDWLENVGEGRRRYGFAWRSLRDAGATLAFSSDWDVGEMDPLVGIYSALTRARLDGTDAWATEQSVDLETAIRAYTFGGAFANHVEDRRGSIVVGKQADLVVLDRDLFAIEEPAQILDARVTHSVVDGNVVYRP
ncbi:MAG TPA: amidohydrolase [Actinomycetota bacterium]|nr:amidohydrolase [Actinomycetota bacterium]